MGIALQAAQHKQHDIADFFRCLELDLDVVYSPSLQSLFHFHPWILACTPPYKGISRIHPATSPCRVSNSTCTIQQFAQSNVGMIIDSQNNDIVPERVKTLTSQSMNLTGVTDFSRLLAPFDMPLRSCYYYMFLRLQAVKRALIFICEALH